MNVTQMIRELERHKQLYGECDILKLQGHTPTPISDIEFIGGSRILLLANTATEYKNRQKYQEKEQEKNKKRQHEWIRDCEKEDGKWTQKHKE